MNRKKLSVVMLFTIILSLMTFVLPVAPVMSAGETISLDTTGGNVGDEIFVDCYGLSANTTYKIYFSPYTTAVISDKSNSSGEMLHYHFTVPDSGSGLHTISLKTSSNTTVASATYTVESDLTLSPKSAKVGDKITVEGTGFLVNNTITLYFEDTNLKDIEADSYGSFNTTITVPDTPYGNYDVSAEDTDNSVIDSLIVTAKIAASNSSPAIGDKITISGTGFSASSSVTFALDGLSINTTATTNANGTLPEKQITIPNIIGGSHTLSVKDINNHSASIPITVTQVITLNPKSGPAETNISVSGAGFVPNTTVTISYKGVSIATSPAIITSDSSGSFTATIKAPKYVAGVYTITAVQGSVTSNASFTQTNYAVLDKETGAVGSMVTASGSGYASGAKISIKYDGTELINTTTDGIGSFSATLKVPPGAAGQHKFIITDGINPTTITFTVTAAVLLGETSGNINSDLMITGYAFTPGSTITIKYDSINISTNTADANGSFSTSLKVPPSKGGNHTIIVTDGASAVSVTFNVEMTPPAEPKLTLPINGDKSNASAKFQWNVVSDPSGPVTYTLQVAQDSTFTAILLEKTGLTSNIFQLTEDQKLKNTEKDQSYYWRVKAIDAASNESAWSAAQTFKIGGSFPSWLLITIYVFAGIILLLVGFIVGGRLKKNT
jgi:hypothetical protein